MIGWGRDHTANIELFPKVNKGTGLALKFLQDVFKLIVVQPQVSYNLFLKGVPGMMIKLSLLT